jgi:hypothetical protein
MRDRINKLCEEARTDVETGDAEAIRALADRIETEVSTVYQPAVDTSERLRNHADALEAGETPPPPTCRVDVLPLTGDT